MMAYRGVCRTGVLNPAGRGRGECLDPARRGGAGASRRPGGTCRQLPTQPRSEGVRRVDGQERDVALHTSKARRPCLRCREPFASTGPGNRLCRRCQIQAADMSPLAPV